MKPPCMIVVQHVLPPLRVAIARELIETHGLKKTKVSKLMGLTPAAITQYMNMKRGETSESIINSDKVREIVSKIA